MARVITFSRVFPAYHPRKGDATYFVEKLSKGFPEYSADDFTALKSRPTLGLFDLLVLAIDKWADFSAKYHTIRSGSRWKVGDKFSPRVWSGKPYASKMITIAPDIVIKKIWELMVDEGVGYIHNGKNLWNPLSFEELTTIAKNDGLNLEDLMQWLKWSKNGKYQIICWNESINY